MLIVYTLPSQTSKPTPEVSGFQPGAVFKDKYLIEKKGRGQEKKRVETKTQKSHCLPIPESEAHLPVRAGTSFASLTLQIQPNLSQKDEVSGHGLGYSGQR